MVDVVLDNFSDVIDSSAHCSVVWLNRSRKIGHHYDNESADELEDDWNGPDQYEKLPTEQQRHLELLEVLLMLNRPIKNIVTAL